MKNQNRDCATDKYAFVNRNLKMIKNYQDWEDEIDCGVFFDI